MNQINPIFEALSSVDERHIPVTKTKKHSKKLKIVLISAAAAAALALSFIVGFVRVGNGVHKFSYTVGGESYEFEVELTPYELKIPEEVTLPLSVDDPYYGSDNFKNAREMFDKLEIEPFMNENFDYSENYARFDIFQLGDPGLGILEISLEYWLYDKNLGKDVNFSATYYSETKHSGSDMGFVIQDDENYEILTLNDGSQCIVTDTAAGFAYNGIKFYVSSFDHSTDIDYMKQVLADLGVYDPN